TRSRGSTVETDPRGYDWVGSLDPVQASLLDGETPEVEELTERRGGRDDSAEPVRLRGLRDIDDIAVPKVEVLAHIVLLQKGIHVRVEDGGLRGCPFRRIERSNTSDLRQFCPIDRPTRHAERLHQRRLVILMDRIGSG